MAGGACSGLRVKRSKCTVVPFVAHAGHVVCKAEAEAIALEMKEALP